MFKVLLIVYIVGGGGSSDVKNTFNTNFVFQEFYSMADCNTAEKEIKNLLNWNRGELKNGEKDMVDALYSTKCVPMTATDAPYVEPPASKKADHSQPQKKTHEHSRWND